MAYKIFIPKEDRKQLWNVVREIIKQHHSKIMKKSKSLRDSFYVVRDYLSVDYLQGGKITDQMFNFFLEDDAYNYFTQDIWTQAEREGYQRPDAKPIGIMTWKGYEHTIDKIDSFLPQIRGFIYVEKEGIASKLEKLSNYGWAIISAQGEATRQIRDLIKRTRKRCVIVHDYDPDGDTIAESIKNKTRRTTHLDISLGSKAVNLMLKDDQIDFLIDKYNMPTQPLPAKHEGRWKRDYRIELSAFIVIDTASGNAVLDFVISEMKRAGLPLSLEPKNKSRLYVEAIKDELEWQINSIIDNVLKGIEIEGEACKAKLTQKVNITKNKKIISAITSAVKGLENDVEWTYEGDMESKILENIPTDWINRGEVNGS